MSNTHSIRVLQAAVTNDPFGCFRYPKAMPISNDMGTDETTLPSNRVLQKSNSYVPDVLPISLSADSGAQVNEPADRTLQTTEPPATPSQRVSSGQRSTAEESSAGTVASLPPLVKPAVNAETPPVNGTDVEQFLKRIPDFSYMLSATLCLPKPK
jgi:hypothetical protein